MVGAAAAASEDVTKHILHYIYSLPVLRLAADSPSAECVLPVVDMQLTEDSLRTHRGLRMSQRAYSVSDCQ